MIKNTRFAKKH